MTKQDYKRFAKEGCAEYGIKVPMTHMVLLETGAACESIMGENVHFVDYVMFYDKRNGNTYQVMWGRRWYNREKDTLYQVDTCKNWFEY